MSIGKGATMGFSRQLLVRLGLEVDPRVDGECPRARDRIRLLKRARWIGCTAKDPDDPNCEYKWNHFDVVRIENNLIKEHRDEARINPPAPAGAR
jgi:hypothetical protein